MHMDDDYIELSSVSYLDPSLSLMARPKVLDSSLTPVQTFKKLFTKKI